MKITAVDNVIERSGLDNETQFKIKASGKAFKILSDGLYSNKIGAVIRELSCNAYDAHVAAGKADVPFDIHLPTRIEPWFSVKDFGIGLSHDDVINLYSTYFESTKNNSNDFVGAFGLGSKSPFSYVDSFSIISHFNGEKRSYTSFITEQGVPSISCLHTEPTSESNGIEVQVPVKENDIETFKKNAEFYLQYFTPYPMINIPEFKFPEITPVLQGDDWKYYGKSTGYYRDGEGFKVRTIQGHVPYEVNSGSFGNTHISQNVRFVLNNLKLEVFFDIGKLEVAASREALSYNKETSENIVKKLEEIYKEIEKNFWEKANSFVGSDWERCKFNSELRREDSTTYDHFNEKDVLKTSFLFSFAKFEDVTIEFKSSGYKRSTRFRDLNKSESGETLRLSPADGVIVFVEDAEVPSTWMQLYFETNKMPWKETQILLVKESPTFSTAQILDGLGNPGHILTSTLVKPPRKPRMSTPPQFVTTVKPAYNRNFKDFLEDELPALGFYMPLTRGHVYLNDKRFSNWDKAIDIALENKWIDETVHDKVFMLTARQVKEVSDNSDWINLLDFLTDKFKEYMNKNVDTFFMYHQITNEKLNWNVTRAYEVLAVHKEFKRAKGTIVETAIKEFNEYKKAKIDSKMAEIAKLFGVEPDISKVTLPKLSDTLNKVYKRYPLMDTILNSGYLQVDEAPDLLEYIELIEEKLTKAGK